MEGVYQDNLREFQEGARCCTVFTQRFKYIAESIREALRFHTEDEKKWLCDNRVESIRQEIDMSSIINLEAAKAIQTNFFENNSDSLFKLETLDKGLKNLLGLPEKP